MKRQPKQYEDDDGRVIHNMDVDGMRWHEKSIITKKPVAGNKAQNWQMTRSESRRYTWYSLLAGMLVASVFSITWVLFILFCTKIWFR